MGIFESIKKRGVLETINRIEENVVWDVRDAFPASEPPLTVQEDLSSETHLPLVDRLVNRTERRDGQAELWTSVEGLSPGTYAAHDRVGNSSEGTAHLHFFVIDRDTEGANFMFVDPEHYLNRSKRGKGKVFREGDIRPRVCNLMNIRMRDAGSPPDIAIVRFRTSELSQEEISFGTQLSVARHLFESEGIPLMLKDKENEIVFRLLLEQSAGKPALVQSRYTSNPEDLRTFLKEGTGFSFLRGKVRSFAGLTGEFLGHLKRGEFKPRTDLEQ